MRRAKIVAGVAALLGVSAVFAHPAPWSTEEIKAREDYARNTTMEAGPDAGISFYARGYGDTEWAVSVFPADPVSCDEALSITQVDLGAKLWSLGFRSMSCMSFVESGFAQTFRYKLLKPLPPEPFKPLHPWRRIEADA